jgi:hypothetical protein
VQKTDYYSSRDLQSRLSYVPVPQPLAWMPLRSWHKESTDTNTRQRQTPCPHWPRYSKDVFPIEGNMIHDPVTHTITTPAMFSPSPMPCRRPLTWPLNKWMYSFQSLQDRDQQQQQILSQYSTAKSLLDGELPFQCLSLWAWMAQVTS